MSPYRVLYQRNPVLPFQFIDQLNNGGVDSVSDCLNLPENDDPVTDLLERLEQICKNVFIQASQNIKKAQKHQAKCYNVRHAGTPCKVGEKKVLKKNMRDASRKAKMRNKYTGPYLFTGISSNGQYYLRDKYSHQLKRPVLANQVVRYYGVGGFCRLKQNTDVENCENHSSDCNGNVFNSQNMPDDDSAAAASDSGNIHEDVGAAVSDSESVLNANSTVTDSQSVLYVASDSGSMAHDTGTVSDSDSIGYDICAAESDSNSIQHNMDISDTESIQESDTDSNIHDNYCQRLNVYRQHRQCDKDKKENLVPFQIMIMQSNDMPFSSDESVLDVGMDDYVQDNHKIFNPWGDMNVNDIPLDIDTDSSTNTEPVIEKPPDVVFTPLSNTEHLNSAKKFYIKLRPSGHTIHFKGIGLVFKHRPVVTIAAKPNGACLFNSMLLLLCGTDVYSQIIRHVICNYISQSQNYSKLQQHIPPQYSSGKDYVGKKICGTALSGVLI